MTTALAESACMQASSQTMQMQRLDSLCVDLDWQ